MAIPPSTLGHLVNPLVTVEQLATSSSSIDGVPQDLEASIRYAATKLTQAAGVLLRLPQDTIAQAIVIFTRFWVGPEGGSLTVHSAKVSPDSSSRDSTSPGMGIQLTIRIRTYQQRRFTLQRNYPSSLRLPVQSSMSTRSSSHLRHPHCASSIPARYPMPLTQRNTTCQKGNICPDAMG